MKISLSKTARINLIMILISAILILVFGLSFGVSFIIGMLVIIASALNINAAYKYTDNKNYRKISRFITIGFTLFLISFVMIVGLIMSEMEPDEDFQDSEIDYVVILGAGLKGDQLTRTLTSRLKAGVDYLKKNQDVPVIVSGGKGSGETITEAKAMGEYLISNGIPRERIIYEEQSTSTKENLTYSQRLMTKGGDSPTVLIITSDYHMFRAKMIGEQLGMTCYGLTGESPFFVKVNYVIREYFGVVKDFII